MNMKRREAMVGTGAFALAAISSASLAQKSDAAHDHAHMHGGTNSALIAAAADCVIKGQACLAHCLELLADGDKAMAACAKSVNQMLAVCAALQNLAAQQSALLPAMAKVALQACQQCEKECRIHEKKHAECKACMESCAQCAKQCKDLAA
jgi:Cys-rich four helix bundle protein (predicted Tat secretion target)